MTRSRDELRNWSKWKRTIILLEETKEQLLDMKKGIPFNDTTEMPGGSHKTIHEKLQKIIEDCDQYDTIINDYKFLVDRLECAIDTVLNKEQKEIVLLYTNYRSCSKRDYEAMRLGYTRTTFYRILNDALIELDKILI